MPLVRAPKRCSALGCLVVFHSEPRQLFAGNQQLLARGHNTVAALLQVPVCGQMRLVLVLNSLCAHQLMQCLGWNPTSLCRHLAREHMHWLHPMPARTGAPPVLGAQRRVLARKRVVRVQRRAGRQRTVQPLGMPRGSGCSSLQPANARPATTGNGKGCAWHTAQQACAWPGQLFRLSMLCKPRSTAHVNCTTACS